MKPLKLQMLSALVGVMSAFTVQAQQQAFSLKQCIDFGLKNHLSNGVYQNKIKQAKEKQRESLSGYLPQVNVNSTMDNNLAIQTNVFELAVPGQPVQLATTKFGQPFASSVSAQLDQQIFNQSLLTGIKASKPYLQQAELQATQNSQQLIYNIASAYFKIIVAQKNIQLLESNKGRLDSLLQITQLQVKQGVVKPVDAQKVQVNLNNVITQITIAKNGYNYAVNVLKNNMGLEPTENVALIDTAQWFQNIPMIVAEDFDYTKTVDYQVQQTQIQLSQFNIKSIRAQFIPTISAYARYGFNGFGTDLAQAYNKMYNFSAVGLKFSWNIFTGLGREAKYKQAVIDMSNAQENLKLNERSQNMQYMNAVNSFVQAQKMLVSNTSNLNLAKDVYGTTLLQYKLGAASLSDLLNVESSLVESQNNYMQSVLDYYVSNLVVHQSNGSLENYFNSL